MVFEHQSVSKSWLTYRIFRDEEQGQEDDVAFRVDTVLNVATVQSGQPAEELIDALTDFLMEHDEIDSVEILPPSGE